MTTANGQELEVQLSEDWEPSLIPIGDVEAAQANPTSALQPGQEATIEVTTSSPKERVDIEYESPSGDVFSDSAQSNSNRELTLTRVLDEIGDWKVTITTESIGVQQTEDWEPTIPSGLEVQQTEDWE